MAWLFDEATSRLGVDVYAGWSMSESDHPNERCPPASTAGEHAMDRWLRQEVVPAYGQLKADPASGLSVDDLRATLARHRHQPL